MKRLLAIGLAVCTILGTGIMIAFGETDTHHTGYTSWITGDTLPTTGTFILETDVTLSTAFVIPSGSNLTLCLNGHQVTFGTTATVSHGGSLQIEDCRTPAGSVRLSATTGINEFEVSGSLTLSGGNISYSSTSSKRVYAVNVADGGSFTMTGGTISLSATHANSSCLQLSGDTLGATATVSGGAFSSLGTNKKSITTNDSYSGTNCLNLSGNPKIPVIFRNSTPITIQITGALGNEVFNTPIGVCLKDEDIITGWDAHMFGKEPYDYFSVVNNQGVMQSSSLKVIIKDGTNVKVGTGYYVTFVSDKGVSPNPRGVQVNHLASKPQDPAVTGYQVEGWYRDVSCTDCFNFSTDTVNNHLTLYSKWIPKKYIITLKGNGGSEGSAQCTYSSPTVTSLVHSTRTGYTLNGYYSLITGGDLVLLTDGNLTPNVVSWTDADGSWLMDSNTNLFARWTPNSYILILDPRGGTIAAGKNISAYTFGTETNLPTASDVSKEGATFLGWYPNTQWTGTPWIIIPDTTTGDITLYAKWSDDTSNHKPHPAVPSNEEPKEIITIDPPECLKTDTDCEPLEIEEEYVITEYPVADTIPALPSDVENGAETEIIRKGIKSFPWWILLIMAIIVWLYSRYKKKKNDNKSME